MEAKNKVYTLSDYECPVCLYYMHPPIGQCVLGHTVCSDCFIRITRCPICRAAKAWHTPPNFEEAHEEITFPCRHDEYGCNKKLKGTPAITKHEASCRYGKPRNTRTPQSNRNFRFQNLVPLTFRFLFNICGRAEA